MPTLGVFAAIFDEAGRLLCVRMNYASKRWSTPGGRVEAGESPLEALKREVLEETGLNITPGELLGVVVVQGDVDPRSHDRKATRNSTKCVNASRAPLSGARGTGQPSATPLTRARADARAQLSCVTLVG